MKYYWADQHLDHINIMKHSKRPFHNVSEMNKTMIDNCKHITDEDELYFGGDICMNITDEIIDMLKSIKGRKYLIIGNHDRKNLKNKEFRDLFVSIKDTVTVHDGDKTIVISHCPFVEWEGFYRGSYHFYGHIHNNDNQANKIMSNIERAYNIGVDVIGFRPLTANEIIKNK